MNKEKLLWYEYLEQAEVLARAVEDMDDPVSSFLIGAAANLEPLYLSDDAITQITRSGNKILGHRYFTDLFSEDEYISDYERLESVFVGAVAHRQSHYIKNAYCLMYLTNPDVPSLHDDLINAINPAILNEAKAGNWDKIKNLETTAKTLGKPLHQRIIGFFATSAAMHRRPF